MVKVITDKGILWDTKKHRFQLNEKDPKQVQISVNDIPKSERRKIEELLRRKNMPTTDEQIVDIYTGSFVGGNN
jgi:hypothetical protein